MYSKFVIISFFDKNSIVENVFDSSSFDNSNKDDLFDVKDLFDEDF
jgi:uncharacterized protein YfkK (UPF0435 family)